MRRRPLPLLLVLGAGSLFWPAKGLRAADPTTAECLAASDASLQSGNEHKRRAERAQLLICAAPSCPADIRKECIRRVDEVNAAIPTIIFDAKDAGGRDLSAVKVSMDGELLAERLDGTALAVDPGEHAFTFETAGKPAVHKQFLIRESETGRHESVAFVLAEGSRRKTGPGLGLQKFLAIVAAGAGVVGLGVASAFGLAAISKKNEAKSACPDLCPDQSGVDKWKDAKTAAQISDAMFIVGGVGLVGAAALWFTAQSPATTEQHAHVELGPSGIQVKGVW